MLFELVDWYLEIFWKQCRLKNLLSKKDLTNSNEKIEDDVSASEKRNGIETKTLQNDEFRNDDREEEEGLIEFVLSSIAE